VLYKQNIFFGICSSERGIKEWQLESDIHGRGKDQETEEEEH